MTYLTRFAEEEDITPILNFLRINKIGKEVCEKEVDEECFGGSTGGKCWVVLEMEDILLGVTRFSLPQCDKKLLLDVFCVASTALSPVGESHTDSKILKEIMNQFLVRIEAIAGGHRRSVVVIEVAHWREDLIENLTLWDYEDRGGRVALASDRYERESTMIIEMHKDLHSPSISSTSSAKRSIVFEGVGVVEDENKIYDADNVDGFVEGGVFSGGLSSALSAFLSSQEVLDTVPTKSSSAVDENIDDLVETLFRALNAENE